MVGTGGVFLAIPPANATSHSHGNPYIGSLYRYDYVPDFFYDLEVARPRDSLRAEQRRLREQPGRQEAQLLLLRNHVDAAYRVSAEQACYYRMMGGFESL